MTQVTDPVILALTGQLPFVLLMAAALAWPISLGLLKLYRRTVLRSMRTSVNPPASAPVPVKAGTPATRPVQTALALSILDYHSSMTAGSVVEALFSDVLRAPWRAAAIYAVAGFCYAIVMAVCTLAAANHEFLPLRFLIVFWNCAWPVVLTVNMVAASTRRAKLATVSIYFLVLAGLGATAVGGSVLMWGKSIGFLWVMNLLVTVLLLAFLNRRVRAVGPLVLTFMVVAITGAIVIPSLAGSDERLLRSIVAFGHVFRMNAVGLFIGLHVLGFAMFGLAGWAAVRWIRDRYERKRISDQSIILDAIWLLFGVVHSMTLVFEGAAWMLSGLGAFAVYKGVAWAGFSLLDNKAGAARNGSKLLLLRVFSLGRRSEQLFSVLGMHWRHVGSIQLIAGPDLATTTIEPHEFLDFLRRKLARRFIDGPETLELRLSEMDVVPDQDGRFRVNDFFCYEDTWKMVLSRLVSESDAVLMDLRGFSPQNAGCRFEINELINTVPLGRVVFIIDDTTDEPFLRQTVQQPWSRLRRTLPNRLLASAQLRLFRFTGARSGELRQLLRAVCVAAKTAPLSQRPDRYRVQTAGEV